MHHVPESIVYSKGYIKAVMREMHRKGYKGYQGNSRMEEKEERDL